MWNQVNKKVFPLYICTSVNYLVTINKNSPVHLKKTSEQACMPVSKLITYSCLVHNNYNLYFSQVQIILKKVLIVQIVLFVSIVFIYWVWSGLLKVPITNQEKLTSQISQLPIFPLPFTEKSKKPSSSQLCMRFDWHFYEYEIMNHSQNMI